MLKRDRGGEGAKGAGAAGGEQQRGVLGKAGVWAPRWETGSADAAGGGGPSSDTGVGGWHTGVADGGPCWWEHGLTGGYGESRAWSIKGDGARGAWRSLRGHRGGRRAGGSPEGRRSPVRRGRAEGNEATARAACGRDGGGERRPPRGAAGDAPAGGFGGHTEGSL